MGAVILVVDDDRSLRDSLVRLLTAHGYVVHDAASAAQALQKARGLRPEVIIMDLHMPGMSGIDAARQVKLQPELKDTQIIGISATAPEWEESQELFATLLLKPCPSAQLLAAIVHALHR